MIEMKETVKAALKGFWDSFQGVVTLYYVDRELEKRRLPIATPTHSHSPVRRRQSDVREQTPIRTTKITKKKEHPTVRSRVFICALLNGVIFLCSTLLFENLFLPFVNFLILYLFGRESEKALALAYWIQLFVSATFHTLWVIPLLLLSRVVNALLFQDIGQITFKYSQGRSNAGLGLSKTVADLTFSFVVQCLFLIQVQVVNFVPIEIVRKILYTTQLSLLYALYAFEYKWSEMGWELHRRLTYIEAHWPYFLGFGLPLVLISEISTFVINGCIFAVLFPFFIISANVANPKPDACFKFRLFSLIVAVTNALFGILGKTKEEAITTKATAHPRR